MKGLIRQRMAAACLAGGLGLAGGCFEYRDLVDPCYPQRYEFAARQEVVGTIAPQVNNGHVLDQTIWNYQFEPGTDRLTPGGMEQLAYLGRRRPAPDAVVFLQTAQDVSYDPAAPDRFAEARANLDNRRTQAIQNYLTAQTAGRHLTFQVVVHDPHVPSIAATPIGGDGRVAGVIQKNYISYQGSLPLTAGAGATNVSGGGGAGGGTGGGAGSPGGSGR